MTRVLVVRVGAEPIVENVESPFSFTKTSLIDGGMVQVIHLDDGIMLYSDEEAELRNLPLNRDVPGRRWHVSREIIGDDPFVIDATDGNCPPPGAMGVHRIFGHFLLTRENAAYVVDLNDEDIVKYSELLALGIPA
jgi:hypothetical protein